MIAYLDNSATTKQYDEVTELMLQMMREDFGNPSSLHSMGVAAERQLKQARARVAEALGALPEEIVFTSGGTEADNLAVKGIARARRREGKKIISSAIEHPAILESLKMLEEDGYEIVLLGVDKNGVVDLEQLEAVVDNKTALVSVMHANNEIGTVEPLDKIAKIVRAKSSAAIHSDCVQSFGKVKIPLNALDLLSISSHKIHGPKGMGALYIRGGNSQKGLRIIPTMTGGGQERALRSGTENMPGIVGFGLACEIAMKNQQANTDRIREMRDFLRAGIECEIKDIKINTPSDVELLPNILNVSFLGVRAEVILHTLEQSGVFVSTGSACSSNKNGDSHVLKALGMSHREIEGALRFSLGAMNTKEEIEYALDELKKAVIKFRKLGRFR